MSETLGFILSFCVFVLAFVLAFLPRRLRGSIKSFHIIFIGVSLSAFLAFLPLYDPVFSGDLSSLATVILSSMHNTIRLYLVDCDMSFVIEQTALLPAILRSAYRTLFNLLMVLAPILTISVVLSFFAGIFAFFRYAFCYFRHAYVFSELNENSLALARSIKAASPAATVVFTDMTDTEDTVSSEMLESATALGAIFFKSDITVANFRFHSKRKKLYFFVIGKDAAKNLDQVVSLAAPPSKKRAKNGETVHNGYDYPADDIRIYLFSTSFASEQRLSAIDAKHLRIRRVNTVQSMIYNLLSTNGQDIFDSAVPTEREVQNRATGGTDKEKKISALIVGTGLCGTEMIKALSWFGQMYPYRIEINAIDKNPNAAELLHASYPDMFDWNPVRSSTQAIPLGGDKAGKFNNGDFSTPGEADYNSSVYPGIDADLAAFEEKLSTLTDTTYVFVAVGSDDDNVRVATRVRILFRRLGLNPTIHTVIENASLSDSVRNGRTASGDSYKITPFGDIPTMYSAKCVLFSELEQKALARHMKYVNHVIESEGITGEEREAMLKREEETFWKYDYNYRSSIASVLHTEFKVKCKVPGSDKSPAERTEAEKWFYRYLEHQRWNAYVRSEGYVYAPVRDKLAKTHHLLVPFDQLPYSEQIKDDD